MIYAIGGVSGSGKSWLRIHHPVLRNLPCFDIEQAYRAAEQQGYSLDWRRALEDFADEIWDHLMHFRGGDVVLETFFRPGGQQRQT